MTLSFSPAGREGIDAFVDGVALDETLGHRGMLGLTRDEWRITARTLQGWMPQDLGLDRQRYVPAGMPIGRGPNQLVPVRQIRQVLVILPGGDTPEVAADDVIGLVDYDRVPLLSCSCGGGVGCAHESVTVTFERSQVHWDHGALTLTFPRHAYDRAILDLLVNLGESPRLISDDEWMTPTPTRVVSGS